MSEWLYGLIKKSDDDRAPDFARQSHMNWARALSYELNAEHGATVVDQRAALRKHFEGSVKPRKVDEDHLVDVFEPLFGSIQGSTSLVSLASRDVVDAWECPTATVTWYYAVYNAFRAMFAARDRLPADTHASAVNALNGELRTLLPHPFDMVAERIKGEKYEDKLPHYLTERRAGGRSAAINGAFSNNRTVARQIILEYLHGSAGYWAEVTRNKIVAKGPYENFKTKAAQEVRDRALKPAVNFLDCAYRYRGKANYRDAIFLSYGQAHARVGLPFVKDLANSGRFVTMMAAAYVRARLGSDAVGAFAADMKENFPGFKTFWSDLPA